MKRPSLTPLLSAALIAGNAHAGDIAAATFTDLSSPEQNQLSPAPTPGVK